MESLMNDCLFIKHFNIDFDWAEREGTINSACRHCKADLSTA